jgi:hypothetical protein
MNYLEKMNIELDKRTGCEIINICLKREQEINEDRLAEQIDNSKYSAYESVIWIQEQQVKIKKLKEESTSLLLVDKIRLQPKIDKEEALLKENVDNFINNELKYLFDNQYLSENIIIKKDKEISDLWQQLNKLKYKVSKLFYIYKSKFTKGV